MIHDYIAMSFYPLFIKYLFSPGGLIFCLNSCYLNCGPHTSSISISLKLLEMQTLRPHLRLTESTSVFLKDPLPRWFKYMLKFEKHCSKIFSERKKKIPAGYPCLHMSSSLLFCLACPVLFHLCLDADCSSCLKNMLVFLQTLNCKDIISLKILFLHLHLAFYFLGLELLSRTAGTNHMWLFKIKEIQIKIKLKIQFLTIITFQVHMVYWPVQILAIYIIRISSIGQQLSRDYYFLS